MQFKTHKLWRADYARRIHCTMKYNTIGYKRLPPSPTHPTTHPPLLWPPRVVSRPLVWSPSSFACSSPFTIWCHDTDQREFLIPGVLVRISFIFSCSTLRINFLLFILVLKHKIARKRKRQSSNRGPQNILLFHAKLIAGISWKEGECEKCRLMPQVVVFVFVFLFFICACICACISLLHQAHGRH